MTLSYRGMIPFLCFLTLQGTAVNLKSAEPAEASHTVQKNLLAQQYKREQKASSATLDTKVAKKPVQKGMPNVGQMLGALFIMLIFSTEKVGIFKKIATISSKR